MGATNRNTNILSRMKAALFALRFNELLGGALINNFSFDIRQLFTPFLDFLGCLFHPIRYFADDFQRCLGAI